MVLTRDSIKAGLVQRMIKASGGIYPVLSEEELVATRKAVLAEAPPGDLWVFGYGSLMWNPAFHFAERLPGAIYGYHRRFCLWSLLGRGSPDRPGLMLALEHGGSCHGIAFRVIPEDPEGELEIIWRREMVSGAYRPRWLNVHTAEGIRRAIAFTINRRHERYAGLLPEDRVVASIAQGKGDLGACADYLFNTVEHLEELGIHDSHMVRLRDQVAALKAERQGA